MTVYLKSTKFEEKINLEDVLSIPIIVGPTTYLIGDFVESRLSNALASISRADGDIHITVDADLEDGVDTVSSQAIYTKFAENYNYPSGISYKTG
jgi:multidrug efflux pump subunit AcrB